MDGSIPEKESTETAPPFTFSSICSQIPLKLQSLFKPHNNRLENVGEKNHSCNDGPKNEQKSLDDWKVDLDKQLQLWRENPIWGDQMPKIDEVVSRKVLLDEGSRQVVELEQAAIWKFLWWTGTLSVHVLVDQNREDHSMTFKQVKAGFMEKFEGSWKIEPVFVDKESCSPFKPETLSDYKSCTRGKGRIGSSVTLEQLLQPSIVPPPPISWYLRGITTKTTEMLLTDMIAEADRIKGVCDANSKESSGLKSDCTHNIKDSWAYRRRNARTRRPKLSQQETSNVQPGS